MPTLSKEKDLKQPNFITQGIRKGTNLAPSQLKERKKLRAEINEIEIRKIIQKINETKSCFLKTIKVTNP